MQEYIQRLQARKREIAKRMKDLEKYIREVQQLDNELQHIDAILHMHVKTEETLEEPTGQIPYIHILYSHNNRKIPSGIARHILALFADNNKPLPINMIHQRLKEQGINTSMSGVNTALRRNTVFFEQIEKFFWRLRITGHQEVSQEESQPTLAEEVVAQ
jgi:hypothetical protein